MQTRFDNTTYWITAAGEMIPIKSMETPHLLNTVKMLIKKPTRTQAMLVDDFENHRAAQVWTPDAGKARTLSIHNATSLTADELVAYAKESPLFKAMLAELESRGVNTKNTVELFESVNILM